MPSIIISASGMATGGRVLHHLKAALPDPRNTVLFVGYQAVGTRGRRLVDGESAVKIHGQMVPVQAGVELIGSMSAAARLQARATDHVHRSWRAGRDGGAVEPDREPAEVDHEDARPPRDRVAHVSVR